MSKTLIIYGTRRGTTTGTVGVIADVLQNAYGHEVTICESEQIKQYRKRIDEFSTIIIGSSIVSGWWKGRVLSFAKKDIFAGKNVALFVTAGGMLNKVENYGITKQEAVSEAIQKYIAKYQKKFKFTPVSVAAFGGRVIRKGVARYDNWDKADIAAWAEELGDLLQKR